MWIWFCIVVMLFLWLRNQVWLNDLGAVIFLLYPRISLPFFLTTSNRFALPTDLAPYISKPEQTLGDVLKAVSKSSQYFGTKQSMKNVAHQFLTHRGIHAQEAVQISVLIIVPCLKASSFYNKIWLPWQWLVRHTHKRHFAHLHL